MELIHDVVLNLSGDNSAVRIMAKQHDKNSRSLRCSFCHAGEAYSLPADVAARVILKKPDGKLVMVDAPVAESVVAFSLTPQMLAASGTANCEIQLYQGEALLSTAAFPLTILPVTYEDGEPESSDEYQSFADALMLLDEWKAEEDARAAAEAARVTAEQGRVSAEAARVQAESARAAAEKQRAAAELERASGFQTMQGQSQTQADYAETQGDYAKEQGDYAKAEYERLQAVDLSGLQNSVNQIASGFGQLESDMDALEPRVGALELFQATKAQANGLASLDAAGKLTQMPSAADVGAVPAAEKGVANGVAALNGSGRLVQMPTAAEVGAVPAAEKGMANGLATLDSAGKLTQMPSAADVGAVSAAEKGAANGVAALDSAAKLPASALPDSAVTSDGTPAGAGSTRAGQLQMSKVLWSGSWATGSITVPYLDNYLIYKINFSNIQTGILAVKNGSNIRGVGGNPSNAQTFRMAFFSANRSGDTLTLVDARALDPLNGREDGALTVANIIGIC